MSVLGIEVIGVLRSGNARALNVVRGGKRAVHVARPGERSNNVEAVRSALFTLDQQRVVSCVRGADKEIDRRKLRKGTEKLRLRDRGVADDAGTTIPVIRVGDRAAEGSHALRKVRRVKLVDVDGSAAVRCGGEIGRTATKVPHFESDTAGKLAFNID